jgi:two-component system response regulator (stage 0 sporulation protein F)
MSSKTKILFVEDDPGMRDVYAENFVAPEFESTIASNGQDALERLKSGEQFDLIISDNYMPEMNGIAMLKEIHKHFPETKVILITGYGNWEDYVTAYDSGVLRFLDKPVKMAELKKLIRELIPI